MIKALNVGTRPVFHARKEQALMNLKKADSMFQEMGMDYWLAKTRKVLEMVRI